MTTEIIHSDIIEWCRNYKGKPFMAILTDPPYHLTSITKRFSKSSQKKENFINSKENQKKHGMARFAKSLKGFMGEFWDGGDLVYQKETWELLSKHLYPGGFIISFSGSRGWHRQAVAMENAGLIMHPTIFGWISGSSMPKATRIKNNKAWVGHRYGLQSLKNALEPILVFQKPYNGRPVDNIIQTGAGALNIDGTRISVSKEEYIKLNKNRKANRTIRSGVVAKGYGFKPEGLRETEQSSLGRWPSNFILLNKEASEKLDKLSGELKSGTNCRRTKVGSFLKHGGLGKVGDKQITYGDEGGASRFFYQVEDQIDKADPIFYTGKASTSERNLGLKEGCGSNTYNKKCIQCGKWARKQKYSDKYTCHCDNPLWEDLKGNIHPTVKPLALVKYLSDLLLPPKEYAPRRILIPFAGVGSEIIGAILSGWEEIIGVEKEDKYIQITNKRISFWKSKKCMYNAQKNIKTVVNKCKRAVNLLGIENYISKH